VLPHKNGGSRDLYNRAVAVEVVEVVNGIGMSRTRVVGMVLAVVDAEIADIQRPSVGNSLLDIHIVGSCYGRTSLTFGC